ncbi:MAG: pilus assembly protein TadG-related protein [Aestuariivirga sp.]
MWRFRQFMTDCRGNVAITFSLAAVPMMIGVGAALDMVNANRVETLLQGAADAAALGGELSDSTDETKLREIAVNYLNANGVANAVSTITSITTGRNPSSGAFGVTVKGKIPTRFMLLAGITEIEVGAYAEAERGGTVLELAMVLDNTGSMSRNGKLEALKSSAKNMVATLLDGAPRGSSVKIGLVPFSEYVNVGMANRSAAWLDVPDDSSSTADECWDTYPEATNCRVEQQNVDNDGGMSTSGVTVCDWGTPLQVCAPVARSSVWTGCVGSRSYPLNVNDGNLAMSYPGIPNVRCPSPLQTLTDNKGTLNSKIDGMIATGNTYIPGGLIWGWNMLSNPEPLSQGRSKAQLARERGKKAVVLMTDGTNTLVPSYPFHTTSSNVTVSNNLTSELCSNIKDDGIIIYTVLFQVSDPTIQSLLENCASATENSFVADNNAALEAAFREIAVSLAQPRLSK